MVGRSKDPTSELETDENQPDRKALEAFVVANVDLERREGLLDRLNARLAELPTNCTGRLGAKLLGWARLFGPCWG